MLQTRSKITLPSGATCVVRKIAMQDCIELRNVPAAFASGKRPDVEPTREQVEYGVKLMRIALLKCCSPLTISSGNKLTIVDKPLDEVRDGVEITIEELDQDDAQAIAGEVFRLSNLGKEAAEKAKPFPEEQTVAG
jgi:hypothetical protein